MTGKEIHAALEKRRLQAWRLHCEGIKQTDIARALGVTQGAVSRWIARARIGGIGSLRMRKPTGMPPRLPREKQQLLPALLARGPAACGLPGERWTRARVGELISREFGVRYSDENISYILRKIGWCGRPLQEAGRPRRAGAAPSVELRSSSEKKRRMQEQESVGCGEKTPSLL